MIKTAGKYILVGGEPVPEPDLLKWARWFESADLTLKRTALPGGVEVSAVFLGLDYSHGPGSPRLWETLIMGGPHDGCKDHYATKAAALDGHQAMIRLALGAGEPSL